MRPQSLIQGMLSLVTFCWLLMDSRTDGHSVVRRNAFQMCNLIHLYTGRSCFRYRSYGCFCGLGQQGTQPVDDTDRCCKEHDDCYGDVYNFCHYWSAMWVGYDVKCDGDMCTCPDEDESCPWRVCHCDLQLAACLARSNYSPQLDGYDRSDCV